MPQASLTKIFSNWGYHCLTGLLNNAETMVALYNNGSPSLKKIWLNLPVVVVVVVVVVGVRLRHTSI